MVAPVPIEGQERVIEKKGILILSPQEKGAHLLNVYFSVLQLPRSHSVNFEYPRDKSLYARYNLLGEGYVFGTGIIYYQNTKIISINRQLEASTEGLGCYLDAVFRYFEIVSPLINSNFSWTYSREPIHIFPPSFDSIVFSLPDGCIAQINTTGYLIQGCEEPATELLDPPPPPPIGDPPSSPPPVGSPPNSGVPGSGAPFIISPPYDGIDDNGDTYVPPSPPPDYPDESDYGGLTYRVDGRFTARLPDGSVFGGLGANFVSSVLIYGKFIRAQNSVVGGSSKVSVEYRRFVTGNVEITSFGFSTGDTSVYFDIEILGIYRV